MAELVFPSKEIAEQISAFRNAFLACGEWMNGAASLARFEYPAEWLNLAQYGGHIAYCVHPEYRRKGKATRMLRPVSG